MTEKILKLMVKLYCPPPPAIPTGGIQLKTGNKYPDTDNINLNQHILGEKTFALNVTFKNQAKLENNLDLCKFGVLDVDQNDDQGLSIAKSMRENLEASGINTLLSFSGNKGYHVTIISEPVPKDLMIQVLKKVKRKFEFKGETIPGDGRRCKLAPCLHQAVGKMSYYFQDEPYGESFGLENLPEGFYEGQLKILENIKPTPANVLIVFASTEDKQESRKDSADLVPDLSKAGNELAPCIKALVDNGGASSLGTWDKNGLTLAGYCASQGFDNQKSLGFAKQMIEKSENGPVESSKSAPDKLNHFLSIQNTPCVTGTTFNCTFMLKARKELKFQCNQCPAKPEGIDSTQNKNFDKPALQLEITLAEDLLAYIIQHGRPEVEITPEIMPETYFNNTKQKCNILKILMKSLNEGVNSEIALAKWLDNELSCKNVETFLTEDLNNFTNKKERVQKLKNFYLTKLRHLKNIKTVDKETYLEILDRAHDLSVRFKIKKSTECLSLDSVDLSKDIYTSSSEFTSQATNILSDSQKTGLIPLSSHYEHLIKYLLGQGSAKTPTPFKELNNLLGGGLANGCKYVLASPPGGGKTTLSSQLADYASSIGIPVIFVSMEMSMEQLFVNSMSRLGQINSSKIMSPYANIKNKVLDEVGEVAEKFNKDSGNLYIIEGDYNTTPARLETMINTIRNDRGLKKDQPFLVVLDYLQLLNTGVKNLDTGPNENLKISELAVRIKQLARNLNVAVLAISDITKEEQKNTYQGKEFSMNSLRGSNRIAHAADCVMVLYSEPAKTDGGKAIQDAWDVFINKVKDSENSVDFLDSIFAIKENIPVGGDGATVYSRLELIKNRGGQGRGNQFLLYHRAFHKFEEVEIDGQAKAEGRG